MLRFVKKEYNGLLDGDTYVFTNDEKNLEVAVVEYLDPEMNKFVKFDLIFKNQGYFNRAPLSISCNGAGKLYLDCDRGFSFSFETVPLFLEEMQNAQKLADEVTAIMKSIEGGTIDDYIRENC
jgi:hypothetical protein